MLAGLAFAQTASETKIESGTSEKKADKADELITNRRFRADQGSLSNWSIRSAWTYSGGSLDRPFAADRPNIASNADVAALQSLSGTLGVSYRMNTQNRLNLSFGLTMDSPFHGSIDESVDAETRKQFNANQGDLDIANPSIGYAHINKFLGVQTILSGSLTRNTRSFNTDRGNEYTVNASFNTMYDVGKTGFSFGLLGAATRNLYTGDETADQAGKGGLWTFGFYPQFEYVINDTFNLRTIARSLVWQSARSDADDYTQITWTQSVGLGISLTRDIFLYPNIQFAPEDITTDRTNVGITANVNLF